MILARDSITVNGVSSDTVGIYVDTPPMPPMSAADTQTIVIPGRTESLTRKMVSRPDIQLDLKLYLFEDELSSDPKLIYAYLSNAKTLRTSKSNNFEYRVSKVLGIMPEYQGHGKQFIIASFMVSPFRYSTDNGTSTVSGNLISVNNNGNVFCQPVYKLYGNGTITMTVNEDDDNTLTVENVNGYVTVDAEKLLCHKDGTFQKFSGQIPFLNVGTNVIQSNADSIDITKNERWI